GLVRLSILIPTLNEARHLSAAVDRARQQAALGPPHEILVADCGSTDGTADLAVRLGARLVQGRPPPSCRASALNRAACAATGDALLSLDANRLAPPGSARAIEQALRKPQVVGGAFEFALDDPRFGLRVVEFINRLRYRLWPHYYGDQGVFVLAAVFRQVGG